MGAPTVSFILPGLSTSASGGYKIVFEYANRLVARGNVVRIYFDCAHSLDAHGVPAPLRRLVAEAASRLTPRWFKLDKRVEKHGVVGIRDATIKEGDVVVATAYETAGATALLSAGKGRKAYLIQDFENWRVDDAAVRATYRLGMHNIVVSSWLKDAVEEAGACADLVSNPIDESVFFVEVPPESRGAHSVSVMYRSEEHKGFPYALAALLQVKERVPDLRAEVFGMDSRPTNLPGWMSYHRGPVGDELRALYNKTAIYLCATVEEGFGLTGAEAMACGCALVSTAYRGVFEYADATSALLSPVRDSDALAENLMRVIKDDALRLKLAHEGSSMKRINTWTSAVDKLADALGVR